MRRREGDHLKTEGGEEKENMHRGRRNEEQRQELRAEGRGGEGEAQKGSHCDAWAR